MKTHSKDVDLIESSLPASQNKSAKANKSSEPRSHLERIKIDIKKYLEKSRAPTTEADIFKNVSGRRQIKLNAISDLFNEGVVRREGAGKRGHPFLYSLPNKRLPCSPETKVEDMQNLSHAMLDESDFKNLVNLFDYLLKIKIRTN